MQIVSVRLWIKMQVGKVGGHLKDQWASYSVILAFTQAMDVSLCIYAL